MTEFQNGAPKRPTGVWPALKAWLRRCYMRATSLSIPWSGKDWYVRFLYGVWSRFYDWSVAWDPAFRTNAKRMVDAAVREGDLVLDVGIGTGLLAEYAAARTKQYVGIDYSGSMLARAARKIAAQHLDRVSLQWGDARSLPFESEMVRVLRPGGAPRAFSRAGRGGAALFFEAATARTSVGGGAGRFRDR